MRSTLSKSIELLAFTDTLLDELALSFLSEHSLQPAGWMLLVWLLAGWLGASTVPNSLFPFSFSLFAVQALSHYVRVMFVILF